MAARTHPTPPPTPARNDTGVVPRWRAWAATAIALVFGWGSGRYGLGNAVAALAWTVVAVAAAVGLTLEVCRQMHRTEFEDIDRRHRAARALGGDHHDHA